MTKAFFEGAKPLKTIYVTAGKGGGDGSADNPFHSIQAAVNAAKPGTMIAVSGGTYNENVKIPHSRSGSDSAPIWLVSADGDGAAKIVAPSDAKPVIQALGVDNYVIKGFALSGGYDGIQFSQSGRDFGNMVQNVAIVSNTITDVRHDGIKVGQADNVFVLGNKISGVANEEGIDFVAVTNAVISGNEVSKVGGTSSAIFAKGGSTHVEISGNYVHDVNGDGISAGGRTDATSFKPGYTKYEGDDIDIVGNRVENVGKHPVTARGAHDVDIRLNQLEASDRYHDAVYVTAGNPRAKSVIHSSDIEATQNAVRNESKFFTIDSGNGSNVQQSGNNGDSLGADVSHILDGMWKSLGAIGHAVKGGPSGTSRPQAGNPVAVGGESGSHTASYADAITGVTANLADPGLNTGAAKGDNHSSIDNLTGSRFDDKLVGDAGANVLDGGAGKDILIGGGGADTFVFSTTLRGSNVDTIQSFSVKDDTMRLDDDVFKGIGPIGELSADAFHINTSGKAHDASDRVIYNSTTGNVFFDADGSGGGAGVKFAHLDLGLNLTHSDFRIVG